MGLAWTWLWLRTKVWITGSVRVKTGPRIETHAAVAAGHYRKILHKLLVAKRTESSNKVRRKYLVVWGNPGHPVEKTKGSKELVWDPVVDEEEGACKTETHKTGDSPTIDDLTLVVGIDERSIQR